MGKTTIILFSIFMSGCCLFQEPEVKIEYVDVIKEVAVHVEPPPEYKPIDLPIFYLDIIMPSAENVDKETAEAYYKSVIILIGEVKKRDNDLNAYRLIKPEEK